ncbi:hypothetical protein NECAME_05281 [Necator americanus]|uniref:RING-type domain-containing protein n=1 Tax=Necator americanus TaxID=51031 RepID=W2SI39_NECAM|nr:hypothetical protein NECAME_05281 [Necator americanus]ETN69299.1 hypothetical protein NECAME_05281 [Necator americanus]
MNECSSGRLVSFLVEGDDVVSCEVCLEPFQPISRPPKILPCGHNFCDQCLFSLCCHQQYYLLDSIRCPTCRASFPTDVAKVAPTNWDLCKILENVQKGREVNVTVIHVPDTPTRVLPSTSTSAKAKSTERTNTLRTLRYRIDLEGHDQTSQQKMLSENIFERYRTEMSPSEVLGELRELRRKLKENLQNSTISQPRTPDFSTTNFLEKQLRDGLTEVNDAIHLLESSSLLHPNKLSEIRTKQIRECSRILNCAQDFNGNSKDASFSTFYERITTPRSKDTLDVGSLDFLLTALPQMPPSSDLRRLIAEMSPMDTPQQRLENFLNAATIITTILYDDVPKAEVAVYADALLHCFHQASILSRKTPRTTVVNSRKAIWKRVQLAYTELLRVGAKNYPSYHPERISLLDDLAYLCHLYADVCDQATVTICMIEAARARASDEKLEEMDRQKTAQRLKEIDYHLLECRRLQRLQDLRTTKIKKSSKFKRLWKFLFRYPKKHNTCGARSANIFSK